MSMSMDNVKFCAKCSELKSADEFGPDKRRNDGRHSWCRPCTAEWARNDRAKPSSRHREHIRNSHLKRNYGLTPEQRDEMFDSVDGKCELCGHEMMRRGKSQYGSVIDHDHVSGKMRGMICSRCNTGLGKLGDSIAGLIKAVDYLARKSG